MGPLAINVLDIPVAICRLEPDAPVPSPAGDFWSIVRTPDELSLMVPEDEIPPGAAAETGWHAFQVAGPLAFDEVGILASLAGRLAEAGISIFAVSTYDTDYLLVRGDDLGEACAALREAGHIVIEKKG
ncbi:hypothetical protein ES708_33269 [subsurface metagenome]